MTTGAVYPDFGAVGGADLIRHTIGALLTIVLIVAVLMLIVYAVTWALAAARGSYETASRSRVGTLVALGAALVSGAGVAWVSFLVGIGAGL